MRQRRRTPRTEERGGGGLGGIGRRRGNRGINAGLQLYNSAVAHRPEALFPHVTPFNNQAGDTLEIPEGPNFTVKLDELKLVHVAPTLPPGGGCRRPDVNVSQMASTLTREKRARGQTAVLRSGSRCGFGLQIEMSLRESASRMRIHQPMTFHDHNVTIE
ncbi:uncharacterized protein LOC143895466 [Temnothorax americanus]|uniref:uncharacterized protein LOC143895466 n=1 Tax=Temnothorax americanus TaxID=1964332 RepID=UPI004068D60E